MATYHITAPDGSAYEVDAPDNAKPQDVYAVLNARLKTQPASDPNLSPLDKRMDERVAKEAAAGFTPGLAPEAGTPIGSWMDEFTGLGNAALNKMTGGRFGETYEEGKAYAQARQRYRDKEHPIAQPLAALAGGLASAPYMPFKAPAAGAGILRQSLNFAANAAPWGALYGAGDDSGAGRTENAKTGAATSAAFGALVPPAGAALARTLEPVMKRSRALPPELTPFDRKAADTMSELFAADNLHLDAAGNPAATWGASQAANKLLDLGDRAMIADLGPNMRGIAVGMAKRPGSEEMSTVVNALQKRAVTAENELSQATDASMGAPFNLPQLEKQMRAQYQAAAKPLYDRFRATPIKPTENLARILDRAQKAGAYDSAQRLIEMEGIDPTKASSNGLFIDLIKRGLDSKIETAQRAGDNTMARALTGIASDLRNETDAILRTQGHVMRDANGTVIKNANGLPMSVYEAARETAGEHLRLKEALEAGQDAFAKGYSADQMAEDLKGFSPQEKFFYRAGARSQISEKVRNAATRWGSNADAAQEAMLGSRAAQDKVRLITDTPQRADRLLRAVNSETEFARTAQPALQNSVTAMAQAAQQRIPGPVEKAASKLATTGTGMAYAAAEKVLDHITSSAITERNIKAAVDMARINVAQGAEARDIARGLFKLIEGRNLTPQQKTAARRVANKLLYSGGAAALNDARSRAHASTP